MKKTIVTIVTALLLCLSLPTTAHGAASIDTDRPCSLTLIYEYDGLSCPGQRVSLYRVAAVSQDGQYTTVGDFAPYPIDLNGEIDCKWLTDTLLAYVTADNLIPDLSAVTDGNGTVTFDGLGPGMYLVTPVAADGLQFVGFAVSLPESISGTWNYHVTALPKGEALGACDVPRTGDKTVAYLWAGALWFSGLGLVWSAVLLRRKDL